MSFIIKARSIVVRLFSRLYQGILLFLFDHRNFSIWAHLVRGFEDHHLAGQHQGPEKRGKYWPTAIFGSSVTYASHDLPSLKRGSMGLTDRRKTAKNLVDSGKNWKILTVSRK